MPNGRDGPFRLRPGPRRRHRGAQEQPQPPCNPPHAALSPAPLAKLRQYVVLNSPKSVDAAPAGFAFRWPAALPWPSPACGGDAAEPWPGGVFPVACSPPADAPGTGAAAAPSAATPAAAVGG